MTWSWDSLRYFVAVADHGTFTDAAKNLEVSHTTVQRRISTLEAELNTQLFIKTTNGFGLTHAGEMLYRETVQVKSALESITRKISWSDAAIAGDVLITSTDSMCFFLLPPLLKQLTELHPALNLKLDMLNRFSDIENLEADIAIRTCDEPPPGLIGRRIGKIRFAACASRRYLQQNPLECFPETAADYRFITLDKSYAATPFAKWLDSKLSDNCLVTVASGFLVAYSLCKADLGITLLPSYVLHEQDELVELDTDEALLSNDLWVLSHADLRDTERVRVARQFIHEKLAGFIEY